MTSSDEIKAGLLAHARWKKRLRQAIQTQESEFEPALVGSDMACDFGKWLNSLSPGDRESTDYQQIKALHREFHVLAGEILEMALSGHTVDAVAELEDGTYGQASGKLVLAMQRWQSKL